MAFRYINFDMKEIYMLLKTVIIYPNFFESEESVYICTVVWLYSKIVRKFQVPQTFKDGALLCFSITHFLTHQLSHSVYYFSTREGEKTL